MEIELKLRLYGVFRDVFQTKEVAMKLPPGATTSDLRAEIISRLRAMKADSRLEGLLARTVFGDASGILVPDAPLKNAMELAILPPVCGG